MFKAGDVITPVKTFTHVSGGKRKTLTAGSEYVVEVHKWCRDDEPDIVYIRGEFSEERFLAANFKLVRAAPNIKAQWRGRGYRVDKPAPSLYVMTEEYIPETFGYHISPITKGELGEISKINEELQELQDAEKQGIKIMMLAELADLYGSIELYLEKRFPDMTMNDLKLMSEVTKRAFKSGRR